MGQVGDGRDVEEPLLRIAGQLAVQEARVLVDLAGPLVEIGRIVDPAALDVALLLQADVELLERPAVALRRGQEVARLVAVVTGVHQERLDRGHDRGHAGGGRAAGRLAVEAVALQQGQRPLVVVGRRVGDPRVAPGRDQVRQRRGHLVRVAIGLRAAHEDRLDDRSLVVLDRVLDRVEPVDGDGVEAPLLDDVADVLGALLEVDLVLVDVALHAGGDHHFGRLRHGASPWKERPWRVIGCRRAGHRQHTPAASARTTGPAAAVAARGSPGVASFPFPASGLAVTVSRSVSWPLHPFPSAAPTEAHRT